MGQAWFAFGLGTLGTEFVFRTTKAGDPFASKNRLQRLGVFFTATTAALHGLEELLLADVNGDRMGEGFLSWAACGGAGVVTAAFR